MLEAKVVGALVQVDGVLAGNNILERRALLAGLGLVKSSHWGRGDMGESKERASGRSQWSATRGNPKITRTIHEQKLAITDVDVAGWLHLETRQQVHSASLLFLLSTRMHIVFRPLLVCAVEYEPSGWAPGRQQSSCSIDGSSSTTRTECLSQQLPLPQQTVLPLPSAVLLPAVCLRTIFETVPT